MARPFFQSLSSAFHTDRCIVKKKKQFAKSARQAVISLPFVDARKTKEKRSVERPMRGVIQANGCKQRFIHTFTSLRFKMRGKGFVLMIEFSVASISRAASVDCDCWPVRLEHDYVRASLLTGPYEMSGCSSESAYGVGGGWLTPGRWQHANRKPPQLFWISPPVSQQIKKNSHESV